MKRCVIVAAGDLYPFPDLQGEQYIIAADGAAERLIRENVIPDLIIGDWDSAELEPEDSNRYEKITLPHEKDDTDTHACVREAIKRGFTEIDIYGAFGGVRADHSIANVQSLIYLAENGCRGSIHTGGQVLTVIKDATLRLEKGHTGYVSVFAMEPEVSGVYIKGMLYEVSDATLKFSFPIGASNELVGKEAEITTNGYLGICYPKGVNAWIK